MPENESVIPIDTMIYGMDKSFSGIPNYDPVVETRTMVNQAISEWPSNLNPADFPLKIHQASITSPISGSNNEHMGNNKPQDGMSYCMQQNSTSMQPQSKSVSTEVAGKAVPNPHDVVDQNKKQQPKTSNSPQTKCQQQRLALKKFSQAVSEEMGDSSTSVDLEQAVLRILAGSNELSEEGDEQTETARGSTTNGAQNRRSNKVFLNKSEAIKAAQAISNLIKQSPGSAYSQPRKSNQNFATNPKVCELCGYEVARSCDLKKHMKRHEKPYGCTYPKCHKRFGAKSDWKRHENSQHFQLEAFRCDQTTKGQICGEHFLREMSFRKHLEAQHKLSDSQQISAEVKRRKIGKNCQQQFWCGFHGDIVELKERRNAAWDERFDHIAYHFEKEKKRIEAWVCAEDNKTKKELLKESDRYVFEDEYERGPASQGLPMGVPQGPPPPPASTMNEQSVSRKRGASDDIVDARSQKKKKHHDHRDRPQPEIVRYCVRISMLWQLLELIFVSVNVTTVPVACCKLGAWVVNTTSALSVGAWKNKRLLGDNVCLKAMSRCYHMPQR
jgi:hypothetical protein